MKNNILVLFATLFVLCSTSFTQTIQTKTITEMGYTTTYSVGTYDATNDCATQACLKDIVTNAPAQGFKQVEVAKASVDIYGLGVDGYIYHLNTAPISSPSPGPAAWVQMTALGNTTAQAISVQNSFTIFAIGAPNGCANGSRSIIKANASLTGWNQTSPQHCSTSLAVSSDGTLASIDSSTGLFTYRLPGVTTWSQAVGNYFSRSPAVTNGQIAYGIKVQGFVVTIMQIDLTTGQTAPVAVNVPSGSFASVLSVTVDAFNNLWYSTTLGTVWHQDRPIDSALGATGPVWSKFAARSTTTNITGSVGFNFALSGTTISHINTRGISMSFSENGAYPSCPNGVNCNTARHTITTHMEFKAGGQHPGGVTYNVSGTVLQQLSLNAVEKSTQCDPFAPSEDNCVIVTFDADLSCSVMGDLFNQPGWFGNWFQPAFTRFIASGNKTCVKDSRSGKNVCSYGVTSYCTANTTPPTLDTNLITNAEDTAGFPVFFDVWGVCGRLASGFPWTCRGINVLPTRVNSYPRADCTVLEP